MRRILVPMVILLAGCSQAKDEAPVAESTAEAPAAAPDVATAMAGTSWKFTQPDVGEVVSTFGTDGRFQAKHGDEVIEQGSWQAKDGKLCEDDDATPDHALACYALADALPEVGATMTVTADDGSTLDVTRVS